MPRRRCPETRSERGSSGEMTDSVLEERKKKKKRRRWVNNEGDFRASEEKKNTKIRWERGC